MNRHVKPSSVHLLDSYNFAGHGIWDGKLNIIRMIVSDYFQEN